MPNENDNENYTMGRSAASMLTGMPDTATPRIPKATGGVADVKIPELGIGAEAQPPSESPLQMQFQSALNTAKSALAKAMRGMGGGSANANTGMMPIASGNGNIQQMLTAGATPAAPVVNKEQPTPERKDVPIGGLAAQGAGVTMNKVGGRDVASYEYGGMMVSLPDGIDLNDDVAVGDAISENNMLVDFLNNGNDDETEAL